MTSFEILNEKPMTMVELKDTLKKIKKRDEELNFRATKVEDYLNQFVVLKPKEADELSKKIEDLKVPRLKEEIVIKIIDILPDTVEELKAIAQNYNLTITKENMEKIIKVVKDFIPEKK